MLELRPRVLDRGTHLDLHHQVLQHGVLRKLAAVLVQPDQVVLARVPEDPLRPRVRAHVGVLDDLELLLDHLTHAVHGLGQERDHPSRDQVGDLVQRIVVLRSAGIVRMGSRRLLQERVGILRPGRRAEVVDAFLFADQLVDERIELARATDVLLVHPLVEHPRLPSPLRLHAGTIVLFGSLVVSIVF